MTKKWISCISCDWQNECPAVDVRFDGYDKTSIAAEDIGCFNNEIYKMYFKNLQNEQQLKLFEM